MTDLPKVQITLGDNWRGKVIVDGHDISRSVFRVVIDHNAKECVPVVVLHLYANVEITADAEVKRIEHTLPTH